jgi:hypothetical protein
MLAMGDETAIAINRLLLSTIYLTIYIQQNSAHTAGHPCHEIQEGAEVLAAFFETRRYGGYMGATTEFSKWEGITYSKSRKQMFTAMSESECNLATYHIYAW